MATPSHFFLINKIHFQIKIELAIEWKTYEPKCGVHKMATPLGIFRGSSLNLKWSKRGVWWVDQWVLIFWLHIESSRAFTWDIDMLIMLVDYFDWGLWYSQFLHASLIFVWDIWHADYEIDYLDWGFWFFLCFIAMFVEYIDMLIILIDHLALLSIVILILAMFVLITSYV